MLVIETVLTVAVATWVIVLGVMMGFGLLAGLITLGIYLFR